MPDGADFRAAGLGRAGKACAQPPSRRPAVALRALARLILSRRSSCAGGSGALARRVKKRPSRGVGISQAQRHGAQADGAAHRPYPRMGKCLRSGDDIVRATRHLAGPGYQTEGDWTRVFAGDGGGKIFVSFVCLVWKAGREPPQKIAQGTKGWLGRPYGA